MLIHSTRTCAQIERGNHWQRLANPINNERGIGGREIKNTSADNLSVRSSGTLLILDGLVYDGNNLHITITPDQLGEWTYLHATQVGGEGKSAYFALSKDEYNDWVAVEKTSYTDYSYKKENVSKTEYFWNKVPQDLVDDISVIIAALVNKEYAKGEAI